MKYIMAALLAATLSSCGPSIEERADAAAANAASNARAELAGQTYEVAIGNVACTSDCSGHEAGFAWAKENNAEDPSACEEADGDSFKEGCAAYGQRIAAKAEDARDAVMEGRDPPS